MCFQQVGIFDSLQNNRAVTLYLSCLAINHGVADPPMTSEEVEDALCTCLVSDDPNSISKFLGKRAVELNVLVQQ